MFRSVTEFLVGLFASATGFGAIALYILVGIGDLYWLWMSIQLGSFWMFLLGLLGPTIFITGPVGAYSLIFGTPDWVFNMFG